MTIPRNLFAVLAGALAACSSDAGAVGAAAGPAQPFVRTDSRPPPLDRNNIANIAVGSADHTTLVAALKAADYVTSVAASGPLTVCAPTNAAFDALPAGTLDSLLKPENQAALKEIIKYHATTSVYELSWFQDGQQLAMANGKKVAIRVADGAVTVNGARIAASIRGSNGILHVIDTVLLPPEK
jgi:uncharacterized surface protein with fasciclin (FAS1) repeats